MQMLGQILEDFRNENRVQEIEDNELHDGQYEIERRQCANGAEADAGGCIGCSGGVGPRRGGGFFFRSTPLPTPAADDSDATAASTPPTFAIVDAPIAGAIADGVIRDNELIRDKTGDGPKPGGDDEWEDSDNDDEDDEDDDKDERCLAPVGQMFPQNAHALAPVGQQARSRRR